MAWNLPTNAVFGGNNPRQTAHTGTGGFLPVTAPTTLNQALGKVSLNGAISVIPNKGCSLTAYYWFPPLGWILAGATAAAQTKTFTAAAIDYFQMPADALFCIVSDATSTICYTDGLPPELNGNLVEASYY